jgi:cobalt-zinc-cadmium efflux system protein
MPHIHDHSHAGGGHSHAHAVALGDARSMRALRLALALTLVVLVAEFVGGLAANSLALLADSGHVLTDAAALALSLWVAWFSRQRVSPSRTYGYLRLEILAALINGATLLGISAWIVVEAVMRFRNPEPVVGGLMLWVAVAGFAVNSIAAWLLHPVNDTNMNVRGAYLHVVGDLLASLGTIVAAVVIRYSGWLAADPISSLLTTALIIRGAWGLLKEAVDVLLESSPAHIAIDDVRRSLESIPGVESVHDLHVWTVSSGMVALSAHAVVPMSDRQQEVLECACDRMSHMGIHHVTVQIEQREMSEREPHLHP